MGVLNYIPKKVKIIDRRSEQGGYYNAECDNCKTKFYPKRSNARFCCRTCAQRWYVDNRLKKALKRHKEGKKAVTTVKSTQIKDNRQVVKPEIKIRAREMTASEIKTLIQAFPSPIVAATMKEVDAKKCFSNSYIRGETFKSDKWTGTAWEIKWIVSVL